MLGGRGGEQQQTRPGPRIQMTQAGQRRRLPQIHQQRTVCPQSMEFGIFEQG
jgi:hypothetical protein